MRSRRLAYAIAACLVALLLPPVAASSPAAQALTGTATLSGSRTASLPVRLTKPVAVDREAFRKAARISGGGRAVGVLLVRQADEPIYMGTMRVSFCEDRGCVDKEPLNLAPTRAPRDDAGRVLLAAGNYRLYLIADGKPAKVSVSCRVWAAPRPTGPPTPRAGRRPPDGHAGRERRRAAPRVQRRG
jgi:hypothetical protein